MQCRENIYKNNNAGERGKGELRVEGERKRKLASAAAIIACS